MASPFDVDPAGHRGGDDGSLSPFWSLVDYLRNMYGDRRPEDDIFDPLPLPGPDS